MSANSYATNNVALAKYDEITSLMRNATFREDVHQALNTPFEVIVVGTMKAGKSTLLNALLGRDLLPTDLDTSTAFPYRIEDCDEKTEVRCRAIQGEDDQEWQEAMPETLRQWNKSSLCSRVEIKGNLPFVRNAGGRLVLYDTPGQNNAVNKYHGEITREVLQNQKYGLILYMLSTRQLSTDNEYKLLRMLKATLRINPSRRRPNIIFVLSQADIFDEGKPEQWLGAVISEQKKFLTAVGFGNPQIVPVMALDALHIHMKRSRQTMTEKQADELDNALKRLKRSKTSLLTHSDCSTTVRSQICPRRFGAGTAAPPQGGAATIAQSDPRVPQDLNRAFLATGLPTLAACLEERLCTQALSETMSQVKKVMRSHKAPQLLRWLDSDSKSGGGSRYAPRPNRT